MASVISSLLLGGCSVFGYRGGTEEPDFTVLESIDSIDIRRYDTRLAADTVVQARDAPAARTAGFEILADYIFGNNQADDKIAMTAPVAQSSDQPADKSSEKIAMTAPVSQDRTADGWQIRFFLPSQYTLDNVPKPNNDRITLTTVAPQTYAVLRFSGSRGSDAVQSQTATLQAAVKASAWQPTAEPVAWFYDPPWTLPFLRRNEVAIEVARSTNE